MFHILRATALALALAVPAGAEVVPLGSAGERELAPFREQFIGLEARIALPDPPPPACGSALPRTHALLVAADAWGPLERFHLKAPQNDTEFLRNSLIARGADGGLIRRLSGADATRPGFEAAAADLLARAGCGDSVILQFSAYAFDARMLAPSDDPAAGPFSSEKKSTTLADLASSALSSRLRPADAVIALGPWIVLNHSTPNRGDLLSADALSDLITALRNRGADVSVILDVAAAETLRVEDRQARVDPRRQWRESRGPGAPAAQRVLTAGAGALSVYYGTEPGNAGIERPLPRGAADSKPYGVFSFELASAILQADRTTAAALMRAVRAGDPSLLGASANRQTYTFVATDPEHDLVVEGRPEIPVQEGSIRILDPAPTRAAAALETAEITLRGQVEAPAETLIVTVNGRVAESATDGQFSTTLELAAGVNRIDILAMTRDNRPVTHSFELYYEGDMQALVGTGTRYALLIANQDYPAGSGLSPLRTPIADATALAEILTRDYGFVTEATAADGRPVPLFLQNATRMQIEATLYDLSRIAGERDQVLIFYAGHGIYEAATDNAYWLPVDARAGLPFSYLPASAITDAILRIGAGSILVISDSCYSGALLRGDPVAEGIEGDRLRALQRLAAKRSRVAISSGANEPVADGGGDGHSVFARALLTGLAEMDDDAFTARELFDDYLLPMVVGRAAQEPQYRPIERSGHEGGDAVLVRAGG